MKDIKFLFEPIYDDRTFKIFFGNEENIEFLQDLLESYFDLEEGTLNNLEIINPIVLNNKVYKKNYELDIKVKLPDGTLIDLEMQNIYDRKAEKKSFTYLSKMFSNQLIKNKDYSNLKNTLCLNFTRELKIHKSNNILQQFNMTNQNNINDTMLKNYFTSSVININGDYEEFKNEKFKTWLKIIGTKNLEELHKIEKLSPKMKRAIERIEEIMSYKYESTLYIQEIFERERRKEQEELTKSNEKMLFENGKNWIINYDNWLKNQEDSKKNQEDSKKNQEDSKKNQEDFKKNQEDYKRNQEDYKRNQEDFMRNQEDLLKIERKDSELKNREDKINEITKNALNEGFLNGAKESSIEIAKNLILNTDYNLENISSWTGVSLCKLEKLKTTLNIPEKKLK